MLLLAMTGLLSCWLQVHLNGSWQDVQPLPGAFIVNLGDMLERYCTGADVTCRAVQIKVV
jgi:isopenicillin N synthase-like dioxygenase